jgi:hypothetical protein
MENAGLEVGRSFRPWLIIQELLLSDKETTGMCTGCLLFEILSNLNLIVPQNGVQANKMTANSLSAKAPFVFGASF